MKNVVFKVAPVPEKVQTRQLIVINGVEMGTVEPIKLTGEKECWHCCLNIPVPGEITTTLLQGFGPTQEEALKETLLKATNMVEALALKISLLKIDVGV